MEDKLKFATVHYGVRERLGISFNEYILLDMIYHLSAKYGYCYKSTASIASDLGLSFNAIKKMVARLEEKGLLTKDQMKLQVTELYVDIAYFDKPVATSEIALSSEKLHKVQSIAQSSDKNNNIDIQKNIMSVLFYELVEILGGSKSTRFPADRLQKLRKRLQTYTAEDMRKAAHSIADDEFMMGGNERGVVYGTIDYLLRNDTNVDKWLQKADSASVHKEITEAILEAI